MWTFPHLHLVRLTRCFEQRYKWHISYHCFTDRTHQRSRICEPNLWSEVVKSNGIMSSMLGHVWEPELSLRMCTNSQRIAEECWWYCSGQQSSATRIKFLRSRLIRSFYGTRTYIPVFRRAGQRPYPQPDESIHLLTPNLKLPNWSLPQMFTDSSVVCISHVSDTSHVFRP